MGCGASRAPETPSSPSRKGANRGAAELLVHGSRGSYAGVHVLELYRQVEEELETNFRARNYNKAALVESLHAAQGAKGLQAKSILMQVYSTQADTYAAFAAGSPDYLNMPTVCALGAGNAIPCSLMIARAAELEAEVELSGLGGADGGSPVAPNTPLLGERLQTVLRLKAMWGGHLLYRTLLMFEHPVMGMIALCQPLLLAACMQRVFTEGEEIVGTLLQAGASPNIRNSLNMTPLMLVTSALAKNMEYTLSSGGSSAAEDMATAVAAASAVVRLLQGAGADAGAEMVGFGSLWADKSDRQKEAAMRSSAIAEARRVLHLERYTVHQAFQLMLGPLRQPAEAAAPGLGSQLDALEELLRGPPSDAQQGQQQGQEAEPLAPAAEVTWPWTQAMSNIAWAVSQVTMVPDARSRRSLLRGLQRQAPFPLPAMSVVSVAQLRQESCIPRFSLEGFPSASTADAAAAAAASSAPPFRPIPVDELPASAVVVFVSHRWLGRGCPDDDKGTKLKQVFAIADHVAKHKRVSPDQVFLWLDYSVVDQSNPMPGVQALPIYIACCDEFVYVAHEEYWERAWCLTEQFMHWKLATAEVKHCLAPDSHGLSTESSRAQPPDPTYGKLACEADRIALATMTSIMPYTLPGDD